MYLEFAEVSENRNRPIEVLRTGVFTDKSGQKVEISSADLDLFVANFASNAAGQGVPVDVDHRQEEAAGWVKSLSRKGDVLLAEIDWNELGEKLVSQKIYQYISAFIQVKDKIIKSVSLVNFPAVKGLKAVTLSDGVVTYEQLGVLDVFAEWMSKTKIPAAVEINKPTEVEMTLNKIEDVNLEKERKRIRAEVTSELKAQEQKSFEIREQVRVELTEKIRIELAEAQALLVEYSTFAQEICSGAAGLSSSPEEIIELMEAVGVGKVNALKRVLSAKVVSFTEKGSTGAGKTKLQELPLFVIKDLKDGEITLSELLETGIVAGKASDYDLSNLTPKEIGG